MADRRVELHTVLCDILGCPTTGSSCHCYFQPPESIKMSYPAIVYSLDAIKNSPADDEAYSSRRRYSVILIDPDPDSEFVEPLVSLPLTSFSRFYTADQLNHFAFSMYY